MSFWKVRMSILDPSVCVVRPAVRGISLLVPQPSSTTRRRFEVKGAFGDATTVSTVYVITNIYRCAQGMCGQVGFSAAWLVGAMKEEAQKLLLADAEEGKRPSGRGWPVVQPHANSSRWFCLWIFIVPIPTLLKLGNRLPLKALGLRQAKGSFSKQSKT